MANVFQLDGIEIRFYTVDHLPAHFHAVHAGRAAKIEFDPVNVIYSHLEPSELHRVVRWIPEYKEELLEAWDAAHQGRIPNKIEPHSRGARQ